MIAPGEQVRVYVATRPVDFRKSPPRARSGGHDGLAAAVQEMFGLDPFGGAVVVFRSKRADRIKACPGPRSGVPVRDRTGLELVHERLEGGRFVWPRGRDGVMRLSPARFAALFEGLDRRRGAPERRRRPQLSG